ncbi:aldo/keto reductase [Nakamurella antarctica]|uniref:Aldo/keto reductase n=1 Tax=Nakamurella antarctica TaxID=1902245 RepID=A0A3G8ZQN6_9ACTN|nr:aldo/keto reductase [Nakamurella antarctica]AZI56864.1 aldo/keto reductase [Nakamurella antarctica]
MTEIPNINLNNGVHIPQLGFGTFQIKPADTVEAVQRAFDAGYRHIDTAQMYGNEKEVGQAIAQSALDPTDVFVTTKLNNNKHSRDDALASFDTSLKDLGLERVDLFLIHWPLPAVGNFVDTWRAMEEIYQSGRARSIGVSNFQAHHIGRLLAETTIPPAVNQIELHPYLVQSELHAYNDEHGIATQAWSPIAKGLVLDDPTIVTVALAHNKSAAQVVLRWQIQLGNIVFPKSATPARIQENTAIFDFELDDSEMSMISSLDRGQRTGPDPDTFNYVP